MPRPFIVISGLPASGKTRLGKRLADAFALPLIDKDEILESLFSGSEAVDGASRMILSRRSDVLFEERARRSDGAVLVSFWHVRGMPMESGTPAAWLHQLRGPVAHVRCVCSPELAAKRFASRIRHPHHLDALKSSDAIAKSFGDLARLGPLDLPPQIDVDTTADPDLAPLVATIRVLLETRPPETSPPSLS